MNDDSPFEVSDHSLKESQREKDWREKATKAIKRADVFIVMLGPKTNKALGVIKEVKVAKDEEKTRFQIIGYKNGSEDLRVPEGGLVYKWNWDNLKKLLG